MISGFIRFIIIRSGWKKDERKWMLNMSFISGGYIKVVGQVRVISKVIFCLVSESSHRIGQLRQDFGVK